MDEAFELLTLTQTGKSDIHPIVLLDPPGGTFWKDWMRFVGSDLLRHGYISEPDLNLFKLTDDVDEAVEEVTGFYRNYHSMRYVHDRLVLRLRRFPDEQALARLGEEFSDIVLSGSLVAAEPSRSEVADDDALDMQRLAMSFDRTHFGRLRALIDRLNEL